MGGGIDASRAAAHDGETGLCKERGETRGLVDAVRGAVARADDGNGGVAWVGGREWLLRERAFAEQQWGRVGELGEESWVPGGCAAEDGDV